MTNPELQKTTEMSSSQASHYMLNIEGAQQTLYANFLQMAQQTSSDLVLALFHRIFIDYTDHSGSEASAAIYAIVMANQPQTFHNTLKHIAYILINTWHLQDRSETIQGLLQQLETVPSKQRSASIFTRRVQNWLQDFRTSDDFAELKLLAACDLSTRHWSQRYLTYLLTEQFFDQDNPIEQRESARLLAQHLKQQFQFNLAMYASKTQQQGATDPSIKNPSILGDRALSLIKHMLLHQNQSKVNYEHLAALFRQQCQGLSYQQFKQSLQQYLYFGLAQFSVNETCFTQLSRRLTALYTEHNNETVTESLILRTCNQLISMLTTEGAQTPSSLFLKSIAPGQKPFASILLLLKIVLLCPHTQARLESNIANLIRAYKDHDREDCRQLIQFLEVFRIVFSVYAGHQRYTLVKMKSKEDTRALDAYRVFTHQREMLSTL
jgi:hypothetical protein